METKKITGSLFMMIKFLVIAWLLLWASLYLVFMVVPIVFHEFTGLDMVLFSINRQSSLICFLGAVLIVAVRRTKVLCKGENIYISRINFLESYKATDFVRVYEKRKSIGYSLFSYIWYERYIVFRDGAEEKQIRLYDYSKLDVQKLLNLLKNEKQCEMADADTVDVIRQPECYKLKVQEIQAREKKIVLKSMAVFLVCGCLCLLLTVIAGNTAERLLLGYFGICAFLIVLSAPIRLHRIQRKRCPERMIYMGNALYIDRDCYYISQIKQVKMTSAYKRSNSILPAQYYMVITYNDQKIKYWLGSEYSNHDYVKLCQMMETVFSAHPAILEFHLTK